MEPNPLFRNQPKYFWANVRAISESVGYTVRGKGVVKVPTVLDIVKGLDKIGLRSDHIVSQEMKLSPFGCLLVKYYEYRAECLNCHVEPRLMDGDRAKKEFERLVSTLKPKCPVPMNKQKGAKKAPAYFTAIINMLIEAHAKGYGCDYDPRKLTTINKDGYPLRTLARRIDGAFESSINPIAVWEIKEYYYTTTFGSRVADGVYESLLDGMELEELREHEKIKVLHYLMIDAHYTWWKCGKSYLCRIIDMLHMGYVDEVLFGYEVIERLPTLVAKWICELESR